MEQLNGHLTPTGHLRGNLVTARTLSGNMTLPRYIGADYFHGEYEYTPTEETQTIEIANKTALENITINPIPDNYGRIAWNGAKLRVY